jgi:hypothetical protein
VGTWGAVANAEEGEVSKDVLIGCEGVMREVDDDGGCSLVC